MDFAFTEDQEALRTGARRFLAQSSTSSQVRAAMKTERGWDTAVWQRIGRELGWPALIVPEEYGGAGAGQVELVGLLEETGRALLCAPLFSTVALATNALLLGTQEAARAAWLPSIAAGECTATLVHADLALRAGAASPGIMATPGRGGFSLSGTARLVVDGHTASLLVVVARVAGAAPGDDPIALFVVPADAAGVERTALATMDMTRRLADVTLRDVRVSEVAMMAEPGAGGKVLAKTLQRACVALAAEQVGGAQRCLDMAVEYAKVRVQFGRPIGSFQAIKHRCADMFVDVESARSAAYWAGCVAAAGDDAELAIVASAARVFCSEAFFRTAAEAIQVHGGVGFTWEHDAHLYFKRAKASEALLGYPSSHRELVAQGIGLG